MKKKFVFSVMLACLMILEANVALFAQTASNEHRLVGSWTFMHTEGSALIFYANGTMVSTNITFDGFYPTHWAAAGDKLLLFIPGINGDKNRAIRYLNISSDGKTLIISTIAVEGAGGVGSIGGAFRRN